MSYSYDRSKTADLQDGPIGRVLNKWWNEVHDLEHDLEGTLRDYHDAAHFMGGPAEKDAKDMIGDVEDCLKLIERLAGGNGVFNKLVANESKFVKKFGEPSAYSDAQRDEIFPR